MASASKKKAQQGNAFLLNNLKMFIISSFVFYAVPSFIFPFIFPNSIFSLPPNKSLIASIITSIISLFLYFQLTQMAKVSKNSLEGKGFHQLMMDFIYINSIVHFLLVFFSRSFYLFLIIPCIGVWKIWEFIKMFKGPKGK